MPILEVKDIHKKFDKTAKAIIITNKNTKNNLLFLYLLNKNGIPFFLFILALHFTFFDIFKTSLKTIL